MKTTARKAIARRNGCPAWENAPPRLRQSDFPRPQPVPEPRNWLARVLGRKPPEVPAALDAMADKVLRYRPKPVSDAAKKRKKKARKVKRDA